MFNRNVTYLAQHITLTLQHLAAGRLKFGADDRVFNLVRGLGILALEMGSQRALVFIKSRQHGEQAGKAFKDKSVFDRPSSDMKVDLVTQPCIMRIGDGREDMDTETLVAEVLKALAVYAQPFRCRRMLLRTRLACLDPTARKRCRFRIIDPVAEQRDGFQDLRPSLCFGVTPRPARKMAGGVEVANSTLLSPQPDLSISSRADLGVETQASRHVLPAPKKSSPRYFFA